MSAATTNHLRTQRNKNTHLDKDTQTHRPSAAPSSLTKFLEPPSSTQNSSARDANDIQPPCPSLPAWTLPHKLSSLWGFSPCSAQDALSGSAKREQDISNVRPKHKELTPEAITSKTHKTASRTRSKSPAAFLSRTLFPSSKYKMEGKGAFEALATHPLHGVKSHKLSDEEKGYTSFPVPVFDHQLYSSDSCSSSAA